MNKKILIARGDQQNAKALSFLLAGSGYQISSHSNAGEAIEAARHQRFDLVITDESIPENNPDLGLVTGIKEAQPSLPIFFISKENSLETVINCIRAGVTEVIPNPSDLRCVIETTNSFLRNTCSETAGEDEITWSDMLEVEKMLEAAFGKDRNESEPTTTSTNSSVEFKELEDKLESALSERDKISGELASVIANLQKSQRTIEELKDQNGNRSTDTEIEERAAALDERERSLKALSAKISLQKVEVETEMGELEAQKIELEEAQKEVQENLDANPTAIYNLNQDFEEEREKLNTIRLENQARIQDLERELEIARNETGPQLISEDQLQKLRESLEVANESLSENKFIIEQRDREIEDLKVRQEGLAENKEIEELEQDKKLLEVEKHKLQEKLDRIELEKRDIEDSHNKHQREIQVERRDAEISLRELQNTIKEEKLQLKVDQANLKEEIRQFEQARQNFQEDIQDLQAKQEELKKMESYLQEKEKSIQTGVTGTTLPKPDAEVMDPFKPTSDPIQNQNTIEQNTVAQQGSEKSNSGQPEKPESWTKPNFDKKAGRGPLRIGRRSSF